MAVTYEEFSKHKEYGKHGEKDYGKDDEKGYVKPGEVYHGGKKEYPKPGNWYPEWGKEYPEPGKEYPESGKKYPEPEHGKHGTHGKCEFEVQFPTYPPLKGGIEAELYENGAPTNYIIRADKEWSIKVHWYLKGALKDCIGGFWCLTLFLESIGPGPEFKIPYQEGYIPLDPCGDCNYWYEIKVPAGKIDAKHCSDPYKLVVALTYLTPCKKPGPMAGFCELPMVQFYESKKTGT